MMIIPFNLSPLAPLVWAENEVTDGHMMLPHFPMIPIQKNESSKLSPRFARRDKNNRVQINTFIRVAPQKSIRLLLS